MTDQAAWNLYIFLSSFSISGAFCYALNDFLNDRENK